MKEEKDPRPEQILFLARSYTKQKLLGDQLAGHGGADGFYIRDNAAGFYFGTGGDLP